MSSIKREIRHFLRRSRAVTKRRDARAKSLFCLINLFLFLFFFLTFSLFSPSLLLKLLINRELKH